MKKSTSLKDAFTHAMAQADSSPFKGVATITAHCAAGGIGTVNLSLEKDLLSRASVPERDHRKRAERAVQRITDEIKAEAFRGIHRASIPYNRASWLLCHRS